MTDREKIIEILDDRGICYKLNRHTSNSYNAGRNSISIEPPDAMCNTLAHEGLDASVHLVFDAADRFLKIEVDTDYD